MTTMLNHLCYCTSPARRDLKRFDNSVIQICETCGKVVQFQCSYCGQNHRKAEYCPDYPIYPEEVIHAAEDETRPLS